MMAAQAIGGVLRVRMRLGRQRANVVTPRASGQTTVDAKDSYSPLTGTAYLSKSKPASLKNVEPDPV